MAVLQDFTGGLTINQEKIGNKFYKHERLCSRKQIDLLFQRNMGVTAFPLKAVFMETDAELLTPLQTMFIVPKRNFKRAHDRNKLKRRMREAYRLNKNTFYELLKPGGKKLIVAFIYTAKQKQEYKEVEASIIKLLGTIVKKSATKSPEEKPHKTE